MYDSWTEAEQQVEGICPNLYTKFTSKKKAQEYVDKHMKRRLTDDEAEEHKIEEVNEVEPDNQGTDELDIEIPTMQKLQEAEEKGQVRVFACHADIGKARWQSHSKT